MNEYFVGALAKTLYGASGRPGRCHRCDRLVNEEEEFRNIKGKKEWKISHLCQQCQDWIFRELESKD